MIGIIILSKKHGGWFVGKGKSKQAAMMSVFALDRAVHICAEEYNLSVEDAKKYVQKEYIDKMVGDIN